MHIMRFLLLMLTRMNFLPWCNATHFIEYWKVRCLSLVLKILVQPYDIKQLIPMKDRKIQTVDSNIKFSICVSDLVGCGDLVLGGVALYAALDGQGGERVRCLDGDVVCCLESCAIASPRYFWRRNTRNVDRDDDRCSGLGTLGSGVFLVIVNHWGGWKRKNIKWYCQVSRLLLTHWCMQQSKKVWQFWCNLSGKNITGYKPWGRYVNWNTTKNSPSNVLWNHSSLRSYFQRYHWSRWQFPEEILGMLMGQHSMVCTAPPYYLSKRILILSISCHCWFKSNSSILEKSTQYIYIENEKSLVTFSHSSSCFKP